MDFHAWNVDLPTGSATHTTGFTIVVEGSPLNPMGVNPGKFPENLGAVEQATLLRCGLEALSRAAQNRSDSSSRSRFSNTAQSAAAIVVEKKASLKSVATERPKPTRPILSLKR